VAEQDVLEREPRTSSRWRGVAVVASGLAVVAAVAVPVWLTGSGGSGSGAAPVSSAAPVADPTPPANVKTEPVEAVLAAGPEITVRIIGGVCDGPAHGAAELVDGRWRLTVWRSPGTYRGNRACPDVALTQFVRVPLPEPYHGQPVVDPAGRTLPVNGGPGFQLPSYLPPGYTLTPGGKGGLTLAGPLGAIELTEGGPDVGTFSDTPGFPYDVLDRPVIAGSTGLLVRFRNEGGNMMLRWTRGDRGLSLQVFSTTLDPQELVRIARSIS
jgi:hypothetical protein